MCLKLIYGEVQAIFGLFLRVLKIGEIIFGIAEPVLSVLAVFAEEGDVILQGIELMSEG